MKKKYQVFISSTYEDLQEERKKVMEALLQMNCFPVGMEYFNASDVSQWEVIKSLIRECDYYILIVAGRYGSIEEESGKSYTQKEFEYAIEQGVPVISFIHKRSEILPGIKIESNPESKKKLECFKSEVKKKLCKFWDNADELASQVVLSLNSLIKTNFRAGWIRDQSDRDLEKQIFLESKFDFTQIHNQIINSKETYIFGQGCTISTKMLYDECINKAKITFKTKFLYMDSNGNAVKIAAKRENNTLHKVKERCNDNFNLIDKMQHRFSENVQYKLIDYLPPYNLFIFNPNDEDGEMLVHISGWSTGSTNGRPLFKLSKRSNKEWFLYFLNEFNTLWNIGQSKQ